MDQTQRANGPGMMDAQAQPSLMFSGASKVEFCRRLGPGWRELADHLEIPTHEQARFERGDEARGIWVWLEQHNHTRRLPDALEAIGRDDLLATLSERQRSDFDNYYRGRIEQWSGPRYEIDRRFVQLSLLLDQGEQAQGPRWAAQEGKYQDLREVLEATPAFPALVPLGPPGSGKSTLLRHTEIDVAHDALDGEQAERSTGWVTFFVELSLYKRSPHDKSLPSPRDWLEQRWEAQFPDMPPLDDLLREKRMLLLLDAINEMPHQGAEHIAAWRDFLALLTAERPGNPAIFSCRTQDYGAKLSTKELPVPQVRLERLSDDQVRDFVEKYHTERGEDLWGQLRRNPRQLDLYRSPYYLRMLVDQVGPDARIPGGRAALFSTFVRQTLNREIAGDNRALRPGSLLSARDCEHLAQDALTGCDLPDEGPLFPALSRLAYRMQETEANREDSQVRVDQDTAVALLGEPAERAGTGILARLRAALAKRLGITRPDPRQAEAVLKADVDLQILEQDKQHRQVLFAHQLLQEYFAARRLAARPRPSLVQRPWRADKARPRLEALLKTLPDSDPLPLLPSTGWEETTVLAAAMTDDPDALVRELMQVNLPLAGRCAAQPDAPIGEDLEAELQRALIARTEDPRADLRARIAAGLALGELGDPHLARHGGEHGDYLLPPLVEIPGGTYPIGSDEGLYDDEAPAHQVELQPFLIARFPVTNAEWALFMAAGGYEDERWWVSEEDQAWRSGESTVEGPKQQLRGDRETFQKNFEQIRVLHQQGRITSKQADDWEQIARMDDAEFEALLDDWYPSGRQTQPDYWDDEGFNNPSQPVVGISWHEARAYCTWLSAQTGRPFRLPTEAEWEAAARGRHGRRFAYGDAFDPWRGNGFETHVRRTTPVGVFPGGATPEGLVDMTGNTWDWTSSLYRPYRYDLGDGREDPVTGEGRRVLRGGSWAYSQVNLRCSARGHDLPADRLNLVGVRLVCSSPIF